MRSRTVETRSERELVVLEFVIGVAAERRGMSTPWEEIAHSVVAKKQYWDEVPLVLDSVTFVKSNEYSILTVGHSRQLTIMAEHNVLPRLFISPFETGPR